MYYYPVNLLNAISNLFRRICSPFNYEWLLLLINFRYLSNLFASSTIFSLNLYTVNAMIDYLGIWYFKLNKFDSKTQTKMINLSNFKKNQWSQLIIVGITDIDMHQRPYNNLHLIQSMLQKLNAP